MKAHILRGKIVYAPLDQCEKAELDALRKDILTKPAGYIAGLMNRNRCVRARNSLNKAYEFMLLVYGGYFLAMGLHDKSLDLVHTLLYGQGGGTRSLNSIDRMLGYKPSIRRKKKPGAPKGKPHRKKVTT